MLIFILHCKVHALGTLDATREGRDDNHDEKTGQILFGWTSLCVKSYKSMNWLYVRSYNINLCSFT